MNPTIQPTTAEPGRKNIATLTTIFFILFAIFCKLLPSDPSMASRLNSLIRKEQKNNFDQFDPKTGEKKDPILNSELPTHDIGVLIRRAAGKPRIGTLLVNLGDCVGCVNIDFALWSKESKKRGIALVAVSYGSAEKVAEMQAKFNAQGDYVAIVRDPDEKIVIGLNGYWSGRSYFYDRVWRLKWIKHGLNPNRSIYDEKSLEDVVKQGANRWLKRGIHYLKS